MGCSCTKDTRIKKSNPKSRPQTLKLTPESFIKSNSKDFTDVYTVGTSLGSGAYGDVIQVIHKLTNQERAVKIFLKNKDKHKDSSYEKTKNEIEILKKLSHPTIIKIFEYFEDEKRVYIVMEKCYGGELFDQITTKKTLNESVSAMICKQLFSAISYLHSNKIVHRDIKPENIMLEDSDDFINIKIIDFGTATYYDGGELLKELTGSSYYISPEVIQGGYNEKCDEWSIGVILYILLCGNPPFGGSSNEEIMRKIKIGTFNYNSPVWASVSPLAKDLLNKLLCHPSVRLAAEEALRHPWIEEKGKYPIIKSPILSNVIENLQSFNGLNKFKDAISTFITSQILEIHETKELREIFKSIDINGDGKLSKEEMINGFACHKEILNRDKYIEKIINDVDTDGNGYIDYNEFIKATVNRQKLYSKDNLKKAFDIFDLDSSGKISAVELEKAFSLGTNKNSIWQDLVLKADKNSDGEIDFQEFCEFIENLSDKDFLIN